MKTAFLLTPTKSLILLLVLGIFAFFFQLQNPVVREWDEATYGINAYEMSQNYQPIMVTFMGNSDVYNSKPPMGLWFMAISTKVFGVNTFALRFPSALFSFLLCLFLFYFIQKRFQNIYWAFYAAAILMASIGFTGWHEARSGDFDAMVAVAICVYVLFFIRALHDKIASDINWAFLFVSMACLIKGIYGIVALPGLFIFMFFQEDWRWAFKQRQLYLGLLSFLSVFIGYYALREYLSPGYLQAVLQNEIGERVFLETNIHKEEIPFYYHSYKLLAYRFQPFILFIPFALAMFWFEPKGKQKHFISGILAAALSIWCIISFSKTKLVWYDGSLYPLFAIFIAWWLARKSIQWQKYMSAAIISMVIFVVYLNVQEKDSFQFPQFLKSVRTEKNTDKTIFVMSKNFEHPIRYCLLQDSLAGYKNYFNKPIDALQIGSLVLVRQEEFEKELSEKFELEVIASLGSEKLFELLDRK